MGFEIVGYFDEIKTFSEYQYLGIFNDLNALAIEFDYIFPAYGAVDRIGVRKRADNVLRLSQQWTVPALISPKAIISKSVEIDNGTYIAHGAVINPKVRIGKNSVINTNSTIGHDVKIGDGSIISGNVFIGGGCEIGERTLIGPGASILHSITIGSDVIVSLGSTVGRSVPDGKTTFPNLAKIY
jgi:sugar O-acyltransferase (sialic acid O-acetyltransferase NeuD family)